MNVDPPEPPPPPPNTPHYLTPTASPTRAVVARLLILRLETLVTQTPETLCNNNDPAKQDDNELSK